MRLFVGSGRITRIEAREANGTRITTIVVPIGGRVRRPDGSWEDDPSKTVWCEISGFDETADDWASRFMKGDTVEFSGTPEIRTYLRGDGTPAAALRIRCGRYDIRKVGGTAEAAPAPDDDPVF